MPIDSRHALILSESDVRALQALIERGWPNGNDRYVTAREAGALSVIDAIRQFIRDRDSDG